MKQSLINGIAIAPMMAIKMLVELKQDFRNHAKGVGETILCYVEKFKIGEGFQIFSSKPNVQFHSSFKTEEEELNDMFHIIEFYDTSQHPKTGQRIGWTTFKYPSNT